MDEKAAPPTPEYNPYLDDTYSPLKDNSADLDFFADEENISISECISEDGIEDDDPGRPDQKRTI